MGIWNSDPFRDVGGPTPVKNIRFENNDIGKIQDNFYATPITDMNLYACTTTMHNGDFERTGEAYWTLKGNANPASAGAGNDDAGQQGSYYGFIDHLDEGDAKIYQGLNLKAGQVYQFRATVQSSGDPCRLFVRDLDTQELIAEKEFSNTEWAQTQLEFAVPRTGNYHIGMERGNAAKGWARMDSADVLCDWNEQTIYTTQVPTDFQKDAQCELGTRFQAKTSGLITRVRIYTNKEESGIHTVRIWDFDKKELVAGPFEWEVPSGREGWQIFTLPKAVRIEADQDYVVAVSSSAEQSYYAYGTGENSFAAPICNRDLITYTGSGLYSATLGAMPDQVQEDTLNYFRDIVFVSDEQTIFTTQEPSAFDNAAQYELGTRFQAKTSGSITKVRIYTSADESGIHTVRLWDYDAQEIIAGPFEWDVASGAEGWQEFVLPEAVKIEANKDYMVAVSNSTDRLYPLGQVESSFTAPICNRDLITYVGSGTYTTALGAMPTSVHAPYYINYFRDVVFVADPWTLGDVNNDGNIDATDALMALQHLVDLRKLEGNAWKAADVNADGKIDATDALLILQKLVGLIDEFPNNP